MNLYTHLSQLRISSKLLLFNVLIMIVLIMVIGTAYLSYRHTQSLLTHTVEQSLDQLTTSGRISRRLSIVFADTNLLFETFYDNYLNLNTIGESLLGEVTDLRQQTGDPDLSEALGILIKSLRKTLEQCSSVNAVLQKVKLIDNQVWKQIKELDKNIAEKLIDWVYRGEDPTVLEQMATMVGSYRESMMEIGKIHAELWPEKYAVILGETSLSIFAKIDNLIVRLHSMTAADIEIAEMVQGLIDQLTQYRQTLVLLNLEMRELRLARSNFDRTKRDVLKLMEELDREIVRITQGVRADINDNFKLIGAVGLLLGIGLIVFIGLATTLFFRNILKRPMHLLLEGVQRFSNNDLESRLELGRNDEWSAIEAALNGMADELSASYTTLEHKINELEENIHARMQAETAVRQSEEKYRSIFENAIEGIYQITEDGRLLNANPAFARIFGYDTVEDMINTVDKVDAQHYVNPSDRKKMIVELHTNGLVSDFEAQYRRVDGRKIWGLVNARYLPDNNGGQSRIEGIFQDITDKKETEAEKAALEEQLRQAQKMEAMGSLAGGIAHDFNNLLHAISGYLELMMLKKSPKDPEYKYLLEISRARERATEIAQRLLTFSRKMETRKVLVDMNEIVISTLKIAKASLPKMISIETNLASKLFQVSTDPTQMEQVLLNLAGNAADAMVDGGRLLIETEAITLDREFQAKYLEMEPGKYVLLKVTDSGVGMDKKTQEHIFEPFFTTKEVGKGTGLGLAIVYGIVKSFKGHLSCYSEPGMGTTFKIYLPAATEADQKLEKATSTFQESAVKGDETILVVDDEKMIREIAREMLSTFGYTVLEAGNGEEALAIHDAQRDEIDLIILDLGMPGMGGERCLEELVRRDPEVKVIVASGYAAHRIVKNPREFGAKRFVSKPYQLQEMLLAIKAVLLASPKKN